MSSGYPEILAWRRFSPCIGWESMVSYFHLQDSYIGSTSASQAEEAGSTPVSCSKRPPLAVFSFLFGALCCNQKNLYILYEDTVMDHCAYTLITTDPVFLNLEGCKDWGYITPAYPQDVWVSGLLRRKLGRHVGLPDRYVFAAGAKAHYCGGLCRHAPRAAGVRCSDAGNIPRSAGKNALG